MSTSRRSFLGSILVLGVAPAVVRASSLMPGRVVAKPRLISIPVWRGGNAYFASNEIILPSELCGISMVTVTEELLNDAVAFPAFIKRIREQL